jgi:hypothetical protein
MTLAALKSAIEALPEEERTALVTWLLSLDRARWDKEICEDFSPGGRGEKLLQEVDGAIGRGDFKPLG